MSNDVVIVSTARTPLAKSWRGGLNMTHGATLAGHAIQHAVERSKIDPNEIEDVLMGCALPEGSTGNDVARMGAIRAGLPVTVGGATINRFCSSGLQAIAMAAHHIAVDKVPVMVAGGVESISTVQANVNQNYFMEPWLAKNKPELYWSMLDTAETVAKRYDIKKEDMDEYGVRSQNLATQAREDGKFDDEIVPITTTMGVADKATGQLSSQEVTISQDEGIRPGTNLEGVSKIRSAMEGGVVTAGNASQFSDGAPACVLMDSKIAEQRGATPLGIFRGFAVAGCEPDEMGIGPIYSVPKLLKNYNLSVDDIDIWELNEAFAVQVVYCRDKLGIPMDKLNLDGGSISIGHPFGMTGSRQVGHLARQLQNLDKQFGVVTMCVGGGMGASGLFERYPS